ncbi:MAG: hypothetical protein IKO49_04610 [Bacilli bacterium]|nr:hypothetical protein [Bacilli bacterium]
MMNSIFWEIVNSYNKKEIAHAFSIILRAHYEKIKMNELGIDKKFELNQMNNFQIVYDDEKFFLTTNKKEIIINNSLFNNLVTKIYQYFKDEYPINYDYKLIDPIFFSLFFYDVLDKIEKVNYDVINISDIRLLRYKSKPVSMDESERYKALIDENYEMYSPFNSNLTIETPKQRLKRSLKSIKEKGYGYNDQYAIFYNDEPYIRDGQHRVAVIKYLYGDIDIKIIRVYLKDNYFYD